MNGPPIDHAAMTWRRPGVTGAGIDVIGRTRSNVRQNWDGGGSAWLRSRQWVQLNGSIFMGLCRWSAGMVPQAEREGRR